MSTKNYLALVAIALGLGFAVNGYAATATGTLSVSATVNSECTVADATLDFANYSPSAEDNTTANIAVTCTTNTSYNVGLSGGASNDVSNRAMTGPNSSELAYNLYQDDAHANVWGETVGTDTVSGTGNGVEQTIPVYGSAPANQNSVESGSYSDTVNITVTY